MDPQSVTAGSNWPFKRPWVLYFFTLIFAVFYVIIFIDEAFPLPAINLDELCVILLFLFFMVGFIFSWFREKTAGYIFILWYILEVIVGIFIWDDADMVLVMGFPLLPMGIFYLVYANRKNREPRPPVYEQWKLFLWMGLLSALLIHVFILLYNLTSMSPEHWINRPYLHLNILFIVFVTAAAIARRNKLVVGLIMVAYYLAIICFTEVHIIDDMVPYNIIMLPVLLLGLLYLVYWIYIRPRKEIKDG